MRNPNARTSRNNQRNAESIEWTGTERGSRNVARFDDNRLVFPPFSRFLNNDLLLSFSRAFFESLSILASLNDKGLQSGWKFPFKALGLLGTARSNSSDDSSSLPVTI